MAKELRCHLASLVDEYNLKLSRAGGSRADRLTQRKLATETKISLTTINRLFRGKFSRLDNQVIVKLCEFFDCDLEGLITLEDKPDEHPPRKAKRKNKK